MEVSEQQQNLEAPSVNNLDGASGQMLQQLRQPLRDELKALDKIIVQQLHSEVQLIEDVVQHLLQAGGKRLRPLLLLLTAAACGYQGEEQLELAAVLEFIHSATLLHDDVVDDSLWRRGAKTAQQSFGSKASILVGDFVYSRAFQLMASRGNVAAMQFMAQVTNGMSEGEVQQLMHAKRQLQPGHCTKTYYQIIEAKTASLFAAATYLGALLARQQSMSGAEVSYSLDEARADIPSLDTMAQCGRELGFAYQIIDDVLDYSGDQQTLGKQLGDDLADGKLTLPLIRTLQQADRATAQRIQTIIAKRERSALGEVLAAMQATDALDYCRQRAALHIQQAQVIISQLPSSLYRQGLYDMAAFLLQRDA